VNQENRPDIFSAQPQQDAFQVIARGIESSNSEVVRDGSVKENRLRRQIADRRTQARKRHGTNVCPAMKISPESTS